ncbi:hypothetical protein HYALB_00009503 [Hymenoscyphus albidus]|uniref:Uncharacterized protein n=1 Tax=Hymenoscyphus albidus TaxID=595503 RepID=A0A9N9LIN8_9HELO|nr:hypothetical protein HYALB_00009503 [Hymenoscyphus albidus]
MGQYTLKKLKAFRIKVADILASGACIIEHVTTPLCDKSTLTALLTFEQECSESYSKKGTAFNNMLKGKYFPLQDGEQKVSGGFRCQDPNHWLHSSFQILITILVASLTGIVGFWAGKSINHPDPASLLSNASHRFNKLNLTCGKLLLDRMSKFGTSTLRSPEVLRLKRRMPGNP